MKTLASIFYLFVVLQVPERLYAQAEKLSFNNSYWEMFRYTETDYKKNDSLFTGKVTLENYPFPMHKSNPLTDIFIHYDSGTKIKVEQKYKNGANCRSVAFKEKGVDGLDRTFYPDGQLMIQTLFNEGVQSGPELTFLQSGKIRSFSEGGNRLVHREWYENGNPSKEVLPLHPEKLNNDEYAPFSEMEWYENGNIKLKAIYYNGKQPVTIYFENGKVNQTGYIYNFMWNQIGLWEYWYLNGQKKAIRNYTDFIEGKGCLKNGRWTEWDEEGKIVKDELYKNEELIKTYR